MGGSLAAGVFPGSCRVSQVFHAAIYSTDRSLSGLRVTAPMAAQFRMLITGLPGRRHFRAGCLRYHVRYLVRLQQSVALSSSLTDLRHLQKPDGKLLQRAILS